MNLQEQISRMKSMMGVIKEDFDNIKNIDYEDELFQHHKRDNLPYHSKYDETKTVESYKEHFMDEVKKYIVEDNKIMLYRVVAVPNESQIKKPFGIYWAFKKEDSNVINWEDINEPENLKVYRITALFDINDIDWKNSFDLYLMNDFMESEIRTKQDVNPTDYFIEEI